MTTLTDGCGVVRVGLMLRLATLPLLLQILAVEPFVTRYPALGRETERTAARLRSQFRPAVAGIEPDSDRLADRVGVSPRDPETADAVLDHLSCDPDRCRDHRTRHRHRLDDRETERLCQCGVDEEIAGRKHFRYVPARSQHSNARCEPQPPDKSRQSRRIADTEHDEMDVAP